MQRLLWGSIPALILALAIGCSDGGDSPTSPDTGSPDTLANFSEVFSLIQARCNTSSNTCHGASAASGFHMAGYDAITTHQAGIGATVDPGNGAGSNLYLKTTSSPPFGQRMPLGQTPLSTSEQQLIKRWIDQGALDN